VKINGSRKVVGTMRGYDQFMNIVLEDAVEDRGAQGKFPIPDMLVTITTPSALVRTLSFVARSRRSPSDRLVVTGDSRQQHCDDRTPDVDAAVFC
jgi:small nuclear ribonucleoprotein (snRNP)-like protein